MVHSFQQCVVGGQLHHCVDGVDQGEVIILGIILVAYLLGTKIMLSRKKMSKANSVDEDDRGKFAKVKIIEEGEER